MTDDHPRYASIRDYLRLLRKQWWLIAIPAILATAAALFFSSRQQPTYAAQAQVLIQDETKQLALLGTSVVPGSSPGASSPAIVAQTFNTPSLAAAVAKKEHLSPSLRGSVSLSVDPTSGLLDVTASAGSGHDAADLANGYAAAIALKTTALAKHQFKSAIRTLQRRVNSLSPSVPSDIGERTALLDEISRLEFLQATSTPGQVATQAASPDSPSSPSPLRDAALGLLAGLLLGVVFAFMRDSFDRRLRGSAEIADELGFRLVAQVRSETMGRTVQPGLIADNDAAGDIETFRILRNNLELLAPLERKRVVLVTSGLPEEGKSTVATSLAVAAASAGRRTLLIDADLRRPAVAQRFGLQITPGLAEHLLGTAEPGEVLRQIPVRVPALAGSNNGGSTEHSGASVGSALVCIPAGGDSGASAELLASARMQALVEQVSSVYDLVVIDSAPLLPVADTLGLLPFVTVALLCVRSGHTTRDQARAARKALEPIAPEAIGVVVTDLKRRDEPAGHGLYPYSYSYLEQVKV